MLLSEALDTFLPLRESCGMGKMIDSAEAAKRLGVDPSRVRQLCRERRIAGAKLLGRSWYLPDDFTVERRARGPRLGSKP